MIKVRRYEANEGAQALGMAVLGVGVVGLVGYLVYRAVRSTPSQSQVYAPTRVERIGPEIPGGRPPGAAPGSTGIAPTPTTPSV